MYQTRLILNEELAEKAKMAAKKDYRSLTSLIAHLLEKHIEEQEKKTKEGE